LDKNFAFLEVKSMLFIFCLIWIYMLFVKNNASCFYALYHSAFPHHYSINLPIHKIPHSDSINLPIHGIMSTD
jgi:hypothetical protein